MAAQILNGTGTVTYTNSTGQNVRIVINFMKIYSSQSMTWTGDNGTAQVRSNGNFTIGKYLGYSVRGKEQIDVNSGASKLITTNQGNRANPTGVSPILSDKNLGGFPTEIALGPGHTFNAGCAEYNVAIIPEAG